MGILGGGGGVGGSVSSSSHSSSDSSTGSGGGVVGGGGGTATLSSYLFPAPILNITYVFYNFCLKPVVTIVTIVPLHTDQPSLTRRLYFNMKIVKPVLRREHIIPIVLNQLNEKYIFYLSLIISNLSNCAFSRASLKPICVASSPVWASENRK